MWSQAHVSKNNASRFWAIGQKGLEISIFRFDVFKYQIKVPDCYTNFEPLNLSHLSEPQLDYLAVKYEYCNDHDFARIALIKWRLDDVRHISYINRMFENIRMLDA